MGSATRSTARVRCSRSTWPPDGSAARPAAASTATPDEVSWALHPLTEEQQEIQKLAREFALAEIAPHSSAWDRDCYFEPSLVKKLGDLGFLGMLLPEEFDGLGVD